MRGYRATHCKPEAMEAISISLHFRDEEERQEVVRRHADLYQRVRRGEITTKELERLSREMIKQYRQRRRKGQ